MTDRRPGIGHNKPPRDKPRLRDGTIYQGFTCGLAAYLFICACADARGYDRPQPNPINGIAGFVIERDALSKYDWELLHFRHDFVLALSWFFALTGSTVTLPNDFIGAGSTIYCIGASVGGGVTGGSPIGGGACSYSPGTAYSPNQVVNIQVGSGDTWFDTSTTILAKAGTTTSGGQASSGFGATKVNGGNPGGGGGGGAGGISAGNNGGAINGGQGDGVIGGAGGTGGAPGSDGTEFQVSPAFGAGGGGSAAICCFSDAGNGGLYGGGGGAGGLCGHSGFGAQGLIAGSYTPSANVGLGITSIFTYP